LGFGGKGVRGEEAKGKYDCAFTLGSGGQRGASIGD